MFLFRHRANIAMLAFKCLQVDLLVLENISAQHLPEPRVSCRVLSHQETFFFSLISRRYIYSLIWIQIELYLDCGAKTTRLRFGIRGQPKVIALSPPPCWKQICAELQRAAIWAAPAQTNQAVQRTWVTPGSVGGDGAISSSGSGSTLHLVLQNTWSGALFAKRW